MTEEAAGAVYEEMQRTDIFTGVKRADFAEALAHGQIAYIGQEVIDALYSAIEARAVRPGICKTAGLKLVYSPLNGSGNVPVRHVLADIGVTDVTVVPEQEHPDGNFPTCPYPNPEIPRGAGAGPGPGGKDGRRPDAGDRPGCRPCGHCRAGPTAAISC